MKTFFFLLLLPILVFAEPVKYADSLMIYSKAFSENREIMISLPESYEQSSNAIYPVIYTVRGQLDMLSVIASLDMLDREVPEFIVIGITGSGAEFHLNETGDQSRFSQFLHKEVVPYTQEKYRTAPYSILVGHSNAGRFVTNDWFLRGTDFNNYISISPGNNKQERELAISIDKEEVQKKGALILSIANEENLRAMFNELESLESLSNKATFMKFPNQTHMSGRIETIMAGLRQSFDGWLPPQEIERGPFEGLQEHYQNLSKQYGFEVNVPLETMKRMSGFDSMSKDESKWKNAANVIDYALTKNPNNADQFFDIVDQVVSFGQTEASKRLVSSICKNTPKHSRCLVQ